jgi:hypothetical protein
MLVTGAFPSQIREVPWHGLAGLDGDVRDHDGEDEGGPIGADRPGVLTCAVRSPPPARTCAP